MIACFPSSIAAQCGVERWSVKTGTDPDAGLVNLNSPTPTTVSYLAGLTAPDPIPANSRVPPTETTLWVLNATLIQYIMSEDSDYHLVLSDGAGQRMVAEIPSPICVGAGSPFAAGIAHARAQFEAALTATPDLQSTNLRVQVTGVGMFDSLHGQYGAAPNGIELHPVIEIIFNPSFNSDFSLTLSPASFSMAQGASGSSALSTQVSGGFNAALSLSASGLPPGASMIFSPESLAAPGAGSATLMISVAPSTLPGTYPLTVAASGGSKTHLVSTSLTVIAAVGGTTRQLLDNPGFENGASHPAPWVASAGVIDNSTSSPAHQGVWKAWLDGYGDAHTDTLMQAVTIPATASSAALSFWLRIHTAETTTRVAYDTLKVQIRDATSSKVLATLATYSNLDANVSYRQVSFDVTAYRGQTIQIYFNGTEDFSLATSFMVDDFALTISQ